MNELPSEDLHDKTVERPLECTECQRAIAVRYTEIVGGVITHTSMCADCPQLERRLHGMHGDALVGNPAETGLVCGDCGTTLSNVRMGSLLGCSHCYEVFGDAILKELQSTGRIPTTVSSKKGSTMPHVGRSPRELVEMSATSRLAALNDALSETLTREDYEQAAWLRDQIKKITETPETGASHEGQ